MKLTERSLVAAFMGDHLIDDSSPTDKIRLKIWKAEEAYITNWMVRNMEVEQKNQYYLMDLVTYIWKEIQKSCAEMQNDWRVYDLLLQVKLIKQRDLFVASYSSKLKSIWREINQLWPVSIQNIEYQKRENKVKTLTFLMGLNSDYESLRAQLIHREKFPALEEVVSKECKLQKADQDSRFLHICIHGSYSKEGRSEGEDISQIHFKVRIQ